jgi:hypothetical protein
MNFVSVYGWKTEDDFYVDDCSHTEKHIDTLSMEGDWKRDVKNVVKRNTNVSKSNQSFVAEMFPKS